MNPPALEWMHTVPLSDAEDKAKILEPGNAKRLLKMWTLQNLHLPLEGEGRVRVKRGGMG